MSMPMQEVRCTGTFGKIMKGLFYVFNGLMALWLLSYWVTLGGHESAPTEAGRAGAAIGGTLGTLAILMFWGVGALILGLLVMATRGQKILIPITDFVNNPSIGNVNHAGSVQSAVAAPQSKRKWLFIVGFGFALLLGLAIIGSTNPSTTPAETPTKGNKSGSLANDPSSVQITQWAWRKDGFGSIRRK
jgi:hypothetical protein